MNNQGNGSFTDKESAQNLIADLVLAFAAPAAVQRIKEVARDQQQSPEEIVRRTAGNMLASFSQRRPGSSLSDMYYIK